MGAHPTTSQKLVLQTVIQDRTCPPDRILLHQPPDAHTQAHIQACALCRERLKIASECPDLSGLAQALAQDAPPAASAAPAPGQIHALHSRLAGWGPKNNYYNPPLVLILDLISKPIPALRVCQIFHHPELCGPEDVSLGPKHGFAQTWNVYTLAQADVQACLGSVSHSELEAVMDHVNQAHPDPEPNTLLELFRQTEIALGSVMASRSLLPALEGSEQPTDQSLHDLLSLQDASALRTYVHSTHPGLKLPDPSGLSPQALLGLARWTDLPLAAAQDSTEINITCAWLDQEQHLRLSPGRADVTLSQVSDQELFITGRFTSMPVQAESLCAWWVENTSIHPAAETEISPDGRFFQISFLTPSTAKVPEALKILILGYA